MNQERGGGGKWEPEMGVFMGAMFVSGLSALGSSIGVNGSTWVGECHSSLLIGGDEENEALAQNA